MKRWLPLFAVICLLWVGFTGCTGDDSSTSSGGDGGETADATADSGFKNDGGPTTDATVTDSGEEASVVDSGEDSAVADAGEDSGFDAGFDAGPVDAGPPFNVSSAASLNDVTITVTFDAPPNPTEAATLGNYGITGGLTLSNPVLAGNVVTLTTTTQSATSYTVTVTGVTRDGDARALSTNQATFTGVGAFDVSSAVSTGSTSVNVTFDATPEMTSAKTPTNYSIPGLTVTAAALSGNVVKLTTTTQTASPFTVTVSNVIRASDNATLVIAQADFTGHPTFNVSSALATNATTVAVTFDAPPNTTNGADPTNYSITGGVTVSAASVSGNVVTLTTSAQSATSLTVTVANVTRASDDEPLAGNAAIFTGIAPFDVVSATATSLTTVDVLFDAAPDPTTANTATNYTIAGLTVSAAVLSGSTVTLTTSTQSSLTYTLNVANVLRASDMLALSTSSASFTQAGPGLPIVSNVVVTATSPDNAAIPYNTGTATLTITGVDFTTVTCPTGVALDDLDGAGNPVSTHPTSCTVNSDTQITAIFPSGIRTNGSTGWNVLVTNSVLTNTTSAVKFVPRAGLLISEVLIGGATASHEFVELYNPTANSINSTTLGLNVHIRNGGSSVATVTDVIAAPTLINSSTGIVPSHGFLLFVSAASASPGDSWVAHGDYSYTVLSGSGLVSDGAVYISLSATNQSLVIDKVGWGNQVAGGFETTASPNITASKSIQRKPAGGLGDATDTDVNSADFTTQSATITPKGTADAIEP